MVNIPSIIFKNLTIVADVAAAATIIVVVVVIIVMVVVVVVVRHLPFTINGIHKLLFKFKSGLWYD